jgi:hypothetical protein
MPNHFLLLLETPRANLSRALQFLNSAYTAHFNRRHGRVGHVFQGRYKSILVDKESYLLELTRYIHLNPVAAGLARKPEQYPWSSYGCYLGLTARPDWLNAEEVLERFAGRKAKAVTAYRAFVQDRIAEHLKEDPLSQVWQQCLLGSKSFIERVRGRIKEPGTEVSHRRALRARDPNSLEGFVRRRGLRGDVEKRVLIYFLRRYTDMTLREICERFGGGHYSRVSQAVRRFERTLEKDRALREVVRGLEERLSNVKV